MKNYTFDKYWFLGFIGLIGFYKLSSIFNYFQGQASIWELSNMLWFIWFLYFVPKKIIEKNNSL